MGSKIRVSTHDELLQECMKDWRYRFWHYALWLPYKIESLAIRYGLYYKIYRIIKKDGER